MECDGRVVMMKQGGLTKVKINIEKSIEKDSHTSSHRGEDPA